MSVRRAAPQNGGETPPLQQIKSVCPATTCDVCRRRPCSADPATRGRYFSQRRPIGGRYTRSSGSKEKLKLAGMSVAVNWAAMSWRRG